MSVSEPERCERCRRLAPPWEDPGYCEWEALELEDGEIGVICPGCITGAEQQEMDADDMDLAEEIRKLGGDA